MKNILYGLLAALLLAWVSPAGMAAEPGTAASGLKNLVGKINIKLQEGKRTEADFTNELKQFDELLAKHKDEKSDEVAQILFMKAKLYEEVFKDAPQAEEAYKQLASDFPETKPAKLAAEQESVRKIKAGLKPGAQFPDFAEQDLEGKPLSIANYKGKVVLIDFCATWCGPCVGELPNVIKTYEKHHGQGFEIIGVSLDQSKEKLTAFLAEKKMTWPQFFDGQGWGNKLAVKYSIQSIPATFLLDGEGKILSQNLRGEALEEAVSKALEKK